MSEFVTIAQIAAQFGVKPRTVRERWAVRPDFPPPARRINRRLVWWRWADVERWATPAAQR